MGSLDKSGVLQRHSVHQNTFPHCALPWKLEQCGSSRSKRAAGVFISRCTGADNATIAQPYPVPDF